MSGRVRVVARLRGVRVCACVLRARARACVWRNPRVCVWSGGNGRAPSDRPPNVMVPKMTRRPWRAAVPRPAYLRTAPRQPSPARRFHVAAAVPQYPGFSDRHVPGSPAMRTTLISRPWAGRRGYSEQYSGLQAVIVCMGFPNSENKGLQTRVTQPTAARVAAVHGRANRSGWDVRVFQKLGLQNLV